MIVVVEEGIVIRTWVEPGFEPVIIIIIIILLLIVVIAIIVIIKIIIVMIIIIIIICEGNCSARGAPVC